VWLYSGRYISTENAYVKADIAQVSSEVAGRVAQIRVHDHQIVQKDEVLVVLDAEPLRIALARADAEVDAARGAVRTLVAAYHEARSELLEAENRSQYWESQLERQKQLSERGVVSSAKLEETENSAATARDRIVVARRKIDRTLAQLAKQPDRPIDQHPLVREKLAARERAAYDLDRAILRAPIAGSVVNVRLQTGEHIKAATPLFVIVSDAEPWVEANFKETELTHVTPGQHATVILDIYPDVEWDAEIQSISPATGAEFALLPPQNASGNWVKVVQRLPVRLKLSPKPGQPPLRAGTTATVRVDTGRKRKLADLFGWAAFATSGK
jgi:membrane fusion protein (multidrug efflux system)